MPYIHTVILSSWSLSDIILLELERKTEILWAYDAEIGAWARLEGAQAQG